VTVTTRRWRLVAGVLCLVAAAVSGIVGYLRLSLEPSLNHQLPYLASAGMALVFLAVVGGALLVVDQLRTDDARVDELARAIELLAAELRPGIERPARHGTATDATARATDPAIDPSSGRSSGSGSP
jgi:hypothetical protein